MAALDGMSWRRFRALLSGITSMPNSALVNRLSAKSDTGSTQGQRSPNSYSITPNSDPAEVRAFFQSIASKKRKPRGRRRGRK